VVRDADPLGKKPVVPMMFTLVFSATAFSSSGLRPTSMGVRSTMVEMPFRAQARSSCAATSAATSSTS
jgi:hypothetical protein